MVIRSRAWTKPVPKRPFTQSMPRLDAVGGRVVGHDRRGGRPRGPRSLDAAAHAAVGAGRVDATHDAAPAPPSGGARPVGQVATHCPQEVQIERRHGAVGEDADPRLVTAADERDGADALDVGAGGRAAAAEDAGLAVEHEERLRGVDGEAVVRRPGRRRPARGARRPRPPGRSRRARRRASASRA